MLSDNHAERHHDAWLPELVTTGQGFLPWILQVILRRVSL
jgi:hypothetical protein